MSVASTAYGGGRVTKETRTLFACATVAFMALRSACGGRPHVDDTSDTGVVDGATEKADALSAARSAVGDNQGSDTNQITDPISSMLPS